MNSEAVISDDGRYRYFLSRSIEFVGERRPKTVVFIMLNPSTADASNDDPTIRRCLGFADREQATELIVVNLCAFRATAPSDMLRADDPVGPENTGYLLLAMRKADLIVCAWGANATLFPVQVEFVRVVAAGLKKRLFHLGLTGKGYPRHPLYLPKGAQLIEWSQKRLRNPPRVRG